MKRKDFLQMPDCFISTGSGREEAEQLREGRKKHRKYVRWNMRNWKKDRQNSRKDWKA